MKNPDQRIEKFIVAHKTLTLATSVNGQPYCCTVFYVFDADNGYFHFMSDSGTRHIKEALENPYVAGTILNETTILTHIQGIQFTGRLIDNNDTLFERSKKLYSTKFPLSKIFSSNIWTIEIDHIKMTDNTLGFGKKIIWDRQEVEVAV